jgi:hypothetical protein
MTALPPSSPSERLNLRTILLIPLQQFAPWLVSVLVVTWAGYPGVVCVTPVAWLIALRVGVVCAEHSPSTLPARRLQEAALAGAWFGLLQGLLFWVVVPLMGPVLPDEQPAAMILAAVMTVAGMLAGAGLSVFTAYQIERRRAG